MRSSASTIIVRNLISWNGSSSRPMRRCLKKTGPLDSTLIAIASRVSLSDRALRDAFFKAAETVSSADDYRRVMTLVLK